MEISNVTMSNQQTAGTANVLNQAEKKVADPEQNNNEGIETMSKDVSEEKKADYSAVSKDGDTLTLSERSKDSGNIQTKADAPDGKVIASSEKMTDAALAKCSTSKLKQLLQQGKISKQQYEKAMKKASK